MLTGLFVLSFLFFILNDLISVPSVYISIIHSLECNKGLVALVPYNCNCIFSTSLELSKVT